MKRSFFCIEAFLIKRKAHRDESLVAVHRETSESEPLGLLPDDEPPGHSHTNTQRREDLFNTAVVCERALCALLPLASRKRCSFCIMGHRKQHLCSVFSPRGFSVHSPSSESSSLVEQHIGVATANLAG